MDDGYSKNLKRCDFKTRKFKNFGHSNQEIVETNFPSNFAVIELVTKNYRV